jgi:hypothetical protein
MFTRIKSALAKAKHKMRSRWTLGLLGLLGLILIGGGVWATIVFRPSWLGIFGPDDGDVVQMVRIASNTKTLWDLMELFVVPASLLIFGYLLSRRQDERADREAERRLVINREIAAEQAEDAALQAYFDAIADLLLTHSTTDENTKEHESINGGTKVWEFARIRTLTTLLRLNGKRKAMCYVF